MYFLVFDLVILFPDTLSGGVHAFDGGLTLFKRYIIVELKQ